VQEIVVLRDILIILAAGALILMALGMALVGWQVYRIARDLRDELQPIIDSVQDTADTVRDTAGFVGERVVAPTTGAVSAAAGAYGLLQLLQQFYRSQELRPPMSDEGR
jgi:hypothetical protein